MTVRILTPWNGYPANAIVSLDAATETALVNNIPPLASFSLTGGVQWSPNTPFDQIVEQPIVVTSLSELTAIAAANSLTPGADYTVGIARYRALSASTFVDDPIVQPWAAELQLTQQRAFEKFDALADWTYTTTSAPTIRVASVSTPGLYANRGFRFSSDIGSSGQNAAVTKNITFNLNTVNGFWLLTDVRFRQTAVGVGVTLYTSDAINLGGGTGRFQYQNAIPARAVSVQPTWVPKSGWTTLDGSPSWANNQLSWRVRIDGTNTEVHDWILLGAFTGGARPTVIITQDDGYDSSYTIAHPACRRRGIPQTHYLIPSLFGTAGYITQAQALEMKAAGDYIGLHGALRWDQNVTRVAADVAACQAAGVGTEHAAYPEGQIGDGTTWQDTREALLAQGVCTARLAGGSTPTLRFVGDPLALTSYPLNNSMSLVQAQAAVDTAIASGGTLIFYGHKYGAVADSLTWVTADFEALLDYIYQRRITGQLDVTTIDKWWDGRAAT